MKKGETKKDTTTVKKVSNEPPKIDKSDTHVIPNPIADSVVDKPNFEAMAVVDSVKPLVGKRPTAQGNSQGKVKLRHRTTLKIITGFIPLHLAEQQLKQNPHIEIITEHE